MKKEEINLKMIYLFQKSIDRYNGQLRDIASYSSSASQER